MGLPVTAAPFDSSMPKWDSVVKKGRGRWRNGKPFLNITSMASILERGVLEASDEAAERRFLPGNSFLQGLPPHVRAPNTEDTPGDRSWLSMQNLREFLMAYCAMFVAVSTFIS